MEKFLFDNIDNIKQYGICNRIANALYHIDNVFFGNQNPDMERQDSFENEEGMRQFLLRGFYDKKNGETIIFKVPAYCKNPDDAKIAFSKSYKEIKSIHLRTFHALWRYANEHGSSSVKCEITDLMDMIADEDRTSYFTQKEKELFRSSLSFLCYLYLEIRKDGKNVFSSPLVRANTSLDKECFYKHPIDVTLLSGKLHPSEYTPIPYQKDTTKLKGSYSYLSAKIQTRLWQTNGNRVFMSWESIVSILEVEKTFSRNPGISKNNIKKLFDTMTKMGIITSWECNEDFVGFEKIEEIQNPNIIPIKNLHSNQNVPIISEDSIKKS